MEFVITFNPRTPRTTPPQHSTSALYHRIVLSPTHLIRHYIYPSTNSAFIYSTFYLFAAVCCTSLHTSVTYQLCCCMCLNNSWIAVYLGVDGIENTQILPGSQR